MVPAADVEGIYVAYLASEVGYGMMLIVFKEGSLTGADAFGVVITGKYTRTDFGTQINVDVSVPAGVALLQGGETSPTGTRYPIRAVLPPDFEDHDFLPIETVHGPLNVRLKKLVNLI